MELVSADLVWEISRSNNAFLVKRRTGGGVQFSRDPLNLTNKHSRKYDGFVNDKAVGVQAGEKGEITLITKRTKNQNKPASSQNKVSFGSNKGSRKVYKGIAAYTAKQGYRSDLRAEAIARASAIRLSQKPKKEAPSSKLRGAKARKAEKEVA